MNTTVNPNLTADFSKVRSITILMPEADGTYRVPLNVRDLKEITPFIIKHPETYGESKKWVIRSSEKHMNHVCLRRPGDFWDTKYETHSLAVKALADYINSCRDASRYDGRFTDEEVAALGPGGPHWERNEWLWQSGN